MVLFMIIVYARVDVLVDAEQTGLLALLPGAKLHNIGPYIGTLTAEIVTSVQTKAVTNYIRILEFYYFNPFLVGLL